MATKTTPPPKLHLLQKMSLWIFLGLLAYMPLHIFISTWAGTSFGVLEFTKVAKDGILVVGFLLALAVSVRRPWFKPLLQSKLTLLILAYAALTILLAIIKPTDQDAEILGVVYNTRFLLFFLYGLLLVNLFPGKKIRCIAVKTVLAAGAVVALFGIFQYFLLPNNALSHVGYARANGVLPAFFIDDKPDLERIMSTLRDPNSLGSYLIVIGMLAAGMLLAVRQKRNKKLLAILLILTVVCLWLTFSRSALIGFAIASAVFVLLGDSKFKRILVRRKKTILATSLVALLILVSGFILAKDTYLVQNVVFHADESTVLEDPNELRKRFWQESVVRITLQPEGGGPGTAGLASIRNDKQGTVLNENYYLQIAEEVGVLGILLFLVILGAVAYKLYQQRQSALALALLASFIGLAFTNLLVHIWSNEAVAYTWWGLAALALTYNASPKRSK